jgi:riboflavin synthase
MFTGLVAAKGVVSTFEPAPAGASISIESPLSLELAQGDSIAINGACVTATEIEGERFRADVVHETLRRTTLGELRSGATVNLELPLRAADRLGGHFVLGHVDGVGEVRAVHDSGEIEIALDDELLRYVAQKGSIAIDGVSLTIAGLDEDGVTIALIPETRAATTLGEAAPGMRVNVEVDILAKHLERLVAR